MSTPEPPLPAPTPTPPAPQAPTPQVPSLFRAFATVGSYTMLSRITGFMREILTATFLGAGAVLAPGKDVVAVEQALLKVVPKEFMDHAHHWLILHGRYTCTARKPLCGQCNITDLCRFRDKNIAG